MSQKELFQHITKEDVLKAIRRVDEEGYSSTRKSSTYDLVYQGTTYPPKYIISLAGYFSNENFILHNQFSGGEESACFAVLREMGFTILPKTETEHYKKAKDSPNIHLKYTSGNIRADLDLDKFNKHFKEYIAHCKTSTWLFKEEKYKFKFARWLSSRVNLNMQKDEEILKICMESQNQKYDEDSSYKGINFILSSLQYSDDFISIENIQSLKKLEKGELIESSELKDTPLSFPKLSVWAGTLLPNSYKPYSKDEFTKSIAYLFNLNKHPKTGIRAFNLATACLNIIAENIQLQYEKELKEIITELFPENPVVQDCDIAWLTQDFNLYLSRKVLDSIINYYWVNQGNTYQKEFEKGIIVAPNSKQHGHKRLKDLLEGDILIHYSDTAIRATSKVVKEFVIGTRPYEADVLSKEDCLIVEVEYTQLESPITIDQIKKIFQYRQDILPKKYSPLTANLGVVQAYCLDFNEDAYNSIFGNSTQNYWIFQGNPDLWDFETALRQELLTDWTVSAHKDKIKVGDNVILWITGNKSGCYALAEVTSEPHERNSSPDDHLWKKEDKSELKADIKITHNFVDSPILKDIIDSHEELKDLKVGYQGTNFSATKEEYDTILKLAMNKTDCKYWLYAPGENGEKWEGFYQDGIMCLGWDELGDLTQYQSKEHIVEKLQELGNTTSSKKNDATANYEFKNVMAVGDVIIVKRGRNELLGLGSVTSDYFFDEYRQNFKHCRKVNWTHKGNWRVEDPMHVKTLTDITNYPMENLRYSQYSERLIAIIKEDQLKLGTMKQAVNTIFYGPPGTGKTYTLKKDYFPFYTAKETSLTKEQNFENVVRESSWWQIIAVALNKMGKSKVSDIFEHPWVQQKIRLSNATNIRPILWSQLQSHTVEECSFVNVKRKLPPLIFNKSEDSFWEVKMEELENQAPEIHELIDAVDSFTPNPDKEIKRYSFITFHQSFGYEDFIEGIKPVMTEEGEEVSDIGYEIQDGIFKELCGRALSDPENRYAIFIDEINRGNVSQIFGELITLIERDKRKGADNEMEAILPYSKKAFVVPSNLDIYGTMNTADRSVEALDTALRRRFSFVEMNPNPSLLKGKSVGPINLNEVLQTINERIELLVDRDHTIGHAYLMNVNTIQELAVAFTDKIIPLLQEYFYGDYGKIGLVLGEGFIEKVDSKNVEFASFKYEGQNDFKTPTFILKPIDEKDILAAIDVLLGTKTDSE